MFRHTHKHYEMDMINGPILGKLVYFAIPLMLTGILQLLYNAADIVVVGRFAGSVALAAVGSTSSLVNLLVNSFIGLSIGVSVAVANDYGAGKLGDVNKTVHTSVAISLIGGVAVGVFGVTMAERMLQMMGTPADVLPHSTLYLQIYFAGMPASMVYNFGAAVLRAVGDTRRPLYYLMISGAINVALNLVFVICFGMGVAGVAVATLISQVVAVALIIACLLRSSGCLNLRVREIRIHRDKLRRILRVGLPAGLQSAVFNVSNIIIQSSINAFGSTVMAGNAAASNIDGFVNTAMDAFSQASLTFAGQNMGAGKPRRIARVALLCSMLVTIAGLGLGALCIVGGPWLLSIYTTDPAVIEMGMARLRVMCSTYCLCGLMNTFVCVMRGMGYALMPMLVTVLGVCGIRLVWIFTVYARYKELTVLYMSYPVSWLATMLVHLGCFIVVYRRLIRTSRTPGGEGGAAPLA